jgi:hypothetical protein
MSQLQSVRVRSQRTAAAAVERARLTLVQTRPTRATRAQRAPFAVLVFLILGAGVVGLLMFNTHMQQASFYATNLQDRADVLQARSQALDLKLQGLRNPQRLAIAARNLGLVTPPNPATIDLRTGKIEGHPIAATPADGTQIRSAQTPLPPSLNRRPILKFVQAPSPTGISTPTTPSTAGTSAKGTAAHGTASTKTGKAPGRNGH